MQTFKAMSHDVIFLAICNTILLLRDIFFTYQTFFTTLHLLRVELRCKLQEKLHGVTSPLTEIVFRHRIQQGTNKLAADTTACLNLMINLQGESVTERVSQFYRHFPEDYEFLPN